MVLFMGKNIRGTLLKVVDVSRSEGPLYQVRGEDEDLIVFDCTVTVLAADDKVYRHKTFSVKGEVRVYEDDIDAGYSVPNFNYKEEVQAFIGRVLERGTIDLRFWEEVPAGPSPEEREAYNLKVEHDERAWEGYR